MKLFIDADGCPVVETAVAIAKEKRIEAVIVKNYAHNISSDYAEVVTVDISRDSADFYIVNHSDKNDIIITQDYGLAAMALSKGSHVITQNGMYITQDNIDQLLNQRHFNENMRRKHKIYSHIKKRKHSDNKIFTENFESLIEKITKQITTS
ncbi:MAG: DUF188 domain-containing protein [Clostridiales bacterium]|nr:DUF188 domain-containing protein [Clostridiales bacterium]